MKALVRCIQWLSKHKKSLLCLSVLLVFSIWYPSYIAGTININMDILDDVEASHIEDNWERLLPLGFSVFSFDETSNYSFCLYAGQSGIEHHFDVDIVGIYIRSENPTNVHSPSVKALYRRVGLLNAMRRLGSFGECTSWVTIETTKCVIYMADYDNSDGKENKFTATLQTILGAIE